MTDTTKLETIDSLRGVASLGVCVFHLTVCTDPAFLPARDGLRAAGALGRYGVEAFFVISGFVIPWSLWRAGYKPGGYPRFIARRLVRLDPPYVLSILATLLLNWVSTLAPGYRGAPFRIDPVQVILHLGYVNVFFGFDWLNVVFWSLAIEFQYYLFIGLVFPLLALRSDARRGLVLLGLGGLAFVLPSEAFLFHYMMLFIMGILTFQLRSGLLGRNRYLAMMALATVLAVESLGPLRAAIALGTALLVAFAEIRSRALAFLGAISYSLYLLHTQIGGRVINLSLRFEVPPELKIAVVLLAIGASLGAAWLFWRFVERPAQRWSARIKYGAVARPVRATVP